MSYSIEFIDDARKEWDKLDKSVRYQFAKKLMDRQKNPIVPKDKLSGMKNCYKIKFKVFRV